MHGTIFSTKFFKMKPPYDLNLMYTQVVELDGLYLFAKDHFYIHWIGFKKNYKYEIGLLKIYTNVWEMYGNNFLI